MRIRALSDWNQTNMFNGHKGLILVEFNQQSLQSMTLKIKTHHISSVQTPFLAKGPQLKRLICFIFLKIVRTTDTPFDQQSLGVGLVIRGP